MTPTILRHHRAVLATLAIIAASSALSAQGPSPRKAEPAQSRDLRLHATAAGRAAEGWLAAYNSGDSARLADFISTRFAPSALAGRGVEALVTRERWRVRNLGPAQAMRIEGTPTDTSISVLVFHPLVDGWGHLTLRLSQDSMRPVSALGLTRMEEPPADLAVRGRLSDERIAAELDAFVGRLARDGRFSGAVGIVRDGRVLLTRSYGMADRDAAVPASVDTRFELASVGKLFTATVIAKLVEEGRLSYGDTIGRWVPEYPNPRARHTVTLRHLLTHSSGIADYFMRPEWERLPMAERERLSLEDHLGFFAADSLAFEPGSRTEYRNSNYLLLGLIAQRAARAPFGALCQRVVFEPARMRATWRDDGTRARGYTFYGPMRTLRITAEPGIATDEPAAGSPAGGGISTVGDMLHFASALIDGTVISRASLGTMVDHHGIDETPTSWAGYGFDAVETWRGARVANKSGNTYGAHSQLDLYPDLGYGVVVLSNLETWAPEAIVYKARELITRR